MSRTRLFLVLVALASTFAALALAGTAAAGPPGSLAAADSGIHVAADGTLDIPALSDGHAVAGEALQARAQATYVYITNTGAKYHRKGCRYLKKSKHRVTLKWAKRHGYTPCKVCKPPR